jgi:hypothetical protein
MTWKNKVIRPLGDPRIHTALNCMARGCPRLPREPFQADMLDAELNATTQFFFNEERNVQVDPARKAVRFNQILEFYTEDFLKKAPSLIAYANSTAPRPSRKTGKSSSFPTTGASTRNEGMAPLTGRAAARLALRFAIGLLLLATSLGKLFDIQGFQGVLKTYQAFPDGVLLPLSLAIPLAELGLAVWLFIARSPAAAAAVSAGLHLLYACWSAISVLRGLKLSNCGCFGVYWPRPLGWSTVIEDLVLAGASLALAVLSHKKLEAR